MHTKVWARKVLPFLVQCAQDRETTTYSIVLKGNGQCSPNMCVALTGDSTQQPSPEQLRTELECSFKYKKWDAVLAALYVDGR